MNVRSIAPSEQNRLCRLVVVGFVVAFVVLAGASQASAAAILALYGDQDGFGVGAVGVLADPTASNAGVGEAVGTDVRLIGPGFSGPAFVPVGGFSFVVPAGEVIAAASLTMRAASFDSVSPVGGANALMLDGLAVNPAFFSQFTLNTTNADNFIEVRTIVLGPAFFASMMDGFLDLAGTTITEGSSSGSFQIDFLQLNIRTEAVPEPASMFLLGTGVLALAGRRYRQGLRRR